MLPVRSTMYTKTNDLPLTGFLQHEEEHKRKSPFCPATNQTSALRVTRKVPRSAICFNTKQALGRTPNGTQKIGRRAWRLGTLNTKAVANAGFVSELGPHSCFVCRFQYLHLVQ
jgi:hypothetical protein